MSSPNHSVAEDRDNDSNSAVEMAETFLWTSFANEACVVEAERQTDL